MISIQATPKRVTLVGAPSAKGVGVGTATCVASNVNREIVASPLVDRVELAPRRAPAGLKPCGPGCA